MRHAPITEDRLRIDALPVKAREKSRRSRAVETTIMKAETDFFRIWQKILASGKSKRKISPQQSHLRWTCASGLSRGKATSRARARLPKLATNNSDAKV
jgi:hypothetical protein